MIGIRGPKLLAQFGVTKTMIRDEDPGWLCDYQVKTRGACFRFQNAGTSLKPERRPSWCGGWIVFGTACSQV